MKEFDISEFLEELIGEDEEILVDLDGDLEVGSNLEQEWDKNADIVGRYIKLSALANYDKDRKKLLYKQAEAKATLKYSPGMKVADATAKTTIDKNVKKAKKKYLEAVKRSEIIYGWLDLVRVQRRKNLEFKTEKYFHEGYGGNKFDKKFKEETGRQLRRNLKKGKKR